MCLGEFEIEQTGCYGSHPSDMNTEFPETQPFPGEWNNFGHHLQQTVSNNLGNPAAFQNVSYKLFDSPNVQEVDYYLCDSPSFQDNDPVSLQNVSYVLSNSPSYQNVSYELSNSPSYQNVSYDLYNSPNYQNVLDASSSFQTGSHFVANESRFEPVCFPRQIVQLENGPSELDWNLLQSNEESMGSEEYANEPVSGGIPTCPELNCSLEVSPPRLAINLKGKGDQRQRRNYSGDSFPPFNPDVTPWDERVEKVTEFNFGRPEWTVAFDKNQSLVKGLLKGRLQTFVTLILQACLGNDFSDYNLTGTCYIQRKSTNPASYKIQGKKYAVPLEILASLITFFESILPQSYLNGLNPNSSVEKMVRRMISRACSRNTEAKNRRKSKIFN